MSERAQQPAAAAAPPEAAPAAESGRASAGFSIPSGLREYYGLAVQRKVDLGSPADGDDALRHAAEGMRGPSGPLPHREQIQASFGRHDISHVRAHTDGGAAAASRAMGAEAFAVGESVGFAGAPSLHTSAHEAAHVVQQRGGVQLKGGVGEAGDAYERHADTVADQVVRGESAESLLDQMAATPGVQRQIKLGTVEYDPQHDNFRQLLVAVQTPQMQLDEVQKEQLYGLFSNGTNQFQDAEALRAELFKTKSGMSPPFKGRSLDSQNQPFFASKSVANARPPKGLCPKVNREKFLIQCAVTGGEIYRYVLGIFQPEMFSTEINGESHRLSEPVEGYRGWPLREMELDENTLYDQQTLLQHQQFQHNQQQSRLRGRQPSNVALGKSHPLIENTNQVDVHGKLKPIEGVLSAYATALFLGDMDLNGANIGLVETEESFHAVKIDPEASFSFYFFDQRPNTVAQNLNSPGDTLGDQEFNDTFAVNISESLGEAPQLVQGLLHCQAATQELFTTIALIICTPLDTYNAIIDTCISNEFETQKAQLKQAMAVRIRIFAQGAQALPGFQQFLQQYRTQPYTV